MTDLLVVPAKKGSDVDLTGPLTNWIKSTFGAENGADSVSDIASFQKLRQTAIRPGDRGENAALACSKYAFIIPIYHLIIITKSMNSFCLSLLY